MATDEDERLDETVHLDPAWIAANGGWIHSNNVLYYFASSPFFDRQSNNSAVFSQSVGNPALEHWLNTRQAFEARLSERPGIEYVVVHDPLQSQVFVNGPDGPEQSKVWVIRKQEREKRSGGEDKVTPLAHYYIMNEAIYQAPSVLKVLTNRISTTITSLTKMISATKDLPVFAPSYGHTYFPPMQKTPHASQGGLSQHSKENTPLPDSQNLKDVLSTKATSEPHGTAVADTRTLIEAMAMSTRYRGEYMDDAPLVGEPGHFRLSKTKDILAPAGQQNALPSKQATPATERAPAPTQAPSPPPAIQTDVPVVSSKKSSVKGNDRSPTTPGGSIPKPKRRKSKIGTTPAA